MTVSPQVLVEWALMYLGFMTLLVLLLFLVVEVGGRRLRKPSGHGSDDDAVLEPCVFTNEEIARLLHYRDAVRAGYFTDQIHDRSGVSQ